MDWIKNRYDQALLAVSVAALLGSAVMLVMKTGDFSSKFASAAATVPIGNKITPLKLDQVEQAREALAKPPVWVIETKEEAQRTRGSLFVSEPYIIDEKGIPVKPVEGAIHTDTLTQTKIPNKWFLENHLQLLEPSAPLQDPDKDGFVNEDEWRANTDPNNKDSHPGYHTKLFFKQYIPIQFRLIFQSYDGVPTKPEGMSFQINTLDLRQPTEFLKIGDTVPKTKFKLEKFEFKEVPNKNTGEKEDVSELTVVNTETGDAVVLVLTKVTNSPDVYALFTYEWPQPHQDIRVKKLQEFVLKPETDKRYKLIDIKENEAVIQLPDGQKYTVVRDTRPQTK